MIDSAGLISTVGLLGIWIIIFAESGLFFGFFLPGDSLLFAAGIAAQAGVFDLNTLILGGIVAAIIGDTVGYITGRRFGPKIFTRDSSLFFNKEYIIYAQKFYEKYGKITIVVARFVPIVRTFAPILAGVGTMKYKTFVFYNIIGGIFWVTSVILLGYYVGGFIPNIDRYILPVFLTIIILSFVPIIIKLFKLRKKTSVTE